MQGTEMKLPQEQCSHTISDRDLLVAEMQALVRADLGLKYEMLEREHEMTSTASHCTPVQPSGLLATAQAFANNWRSLLSVRLFAECGHNWTSRVSCPVRLYWR